MSVCVCVVVVYKLKQHRYFLQLDIAFKTGQVYKDSLEFAVHSANT